MFNTLIKGFNGLFSKLQRQGTITEHNIDAVFEDIRTSLLEADVHHDAVTRFLDDVKQKAIGQKIHKALSPHQQLLKILNGSLTELLGKDSSSLSLGGTPAVIMLVGLQGSGKTTTAVKLARYLKEKMNRNPILVGTDFSRPAAVEQLSVLAKTAGIDCYEATKRTAIDAVNEAKVFAGKNINDVIIVDTAGRLHIDSDLMQELNSLKKNFSPTEILLVADSMLGQDAVNVAREFNSLLNLTGFILTKLDSDTRGGAALSLYYTTGKPIKFMGLGEKTDALEVFHPERVASRILDLGDMMTLLERAESQFDKKQAEKLQKKLKKNEFDLEDFYDQIKQIKKLGSMESLLSMIPGMSGLKGKLKGLTPPDEELKKIDTIIHSMTVKERQKPEIIDGSRKKRIALGSGTSVNDVNKFLKSFNDMKKMMKLLPKSGFSDLGLGLGKGISNINKPGGF
jgi:signal recognition particle subunit SRP54